MLSSIPVDADRLALFFLEAAPGFDGFTAEGVPIRTIIALASTDGLTSGQSVILRVPMAGDVAFAPLTRLMGVGLVAQAEGYLMSADSLIEYKPPKPASDQPAPRRPGRPRGSRNKPKPPTQAEPPATPTPVIQQAHFVDIRDEPPPPVLEDRTP